MTSAADPNANVIFGAVIDEARTDEVRVTVIATGFGQQRRRRTSTPSPTPTPFTPGPTQGTDPPSDLLEVPSFLRDQ